MTHKKEALNSKTASSFMRAGNMPKKRMNCWHCHLNGYNILDKFGCCKRCGTNLKKYPTSESHPYPDLDDEKLAQEVLGAREKFKIPEDTEFPDEIDPSKLPIKWNPLQQWVHFTDKNGKLQHKRLDPKCSECGKFATHLLVRRSNKGTKLYRCDSCYDKNPEWEADEIEEKNTQKKRYKKWDKYP